MGGQIPKKKRKTIIWRSKAKSIHVKS